ncbi:hypothetical protein [Pseudovibrio sp. Ad26]|uniref:phage head-tail joining protein n=1 Tax=Pseudovibrio sp. Ad26 TaxID=989410 RepID=UPI0007AEDC80|nr:hypothetical protein [Pseudovibrio sp. Ad26]KZL02648.1 hypothetical protein PsAD26_04729 [Pseudovibrio sp. Ad26]
MSWTSAELAALKKAYAAGATRVSYEGKTVEYDSGAQLLARIRIIDAEITAISGKKKPLAGFVLFTREIR